MKVKLHLNKIQWNILANMVREMAVNAPIDGHLLASCVVAEMYKRRLDSFMFYKPAGDLKLMTFTFTASEAIALNDMGDLNPFYNTFLRMIIEPYLPMPKSKA